MKQQPVPLWRKSSHSGHQGGECIEVAELPDGIAVRDSKDPSGHIHTFGKTAFRGFTRALRERHGAP